MNDFQRAINKALKRRREEVQRVQQDFVKTLLDIEKGLGDEFELPKIIENLMATDGLDGEGEGDADKSAQILTQEQPEPSSFRSSGRGEFEAAESLVAIICEPIPADRNLLKKSPDYHYFQNYLCGSTDA